jgi:hypothetical protein
LAPTIETLKRQLIESEFDGKSVEERHRRYLKLYDQPSYLRSLCADWIEFCAATAPHGRFFLYLEQEGNRRMVPCTSKNEALTVIRQIY